MCPFCQVGNWRSHWDADTACLKLIIRQVSRFAVLRRDQFPQSRSELRWEAVAPVLVDQPDTGQIKQIKQMNLVFPAKGGELHRTKASSVATMQNSDGNHAKLRHTGFHTGFPSDLRTASAMDHDPRSSWRVERAGGRDSSGSAAARGNTHLSQDRKRPDSHGVGSNRSAAA